MAQFLAPIINSQQEDANGDPLSGGKIEVYLAGSSTPATTYNDKDGLPGHANTWPIVLNTLGVNQQGPVWLVGGAAYKYVIKNAAGVVQRTIDNISGINDTTGVLDQWLLFQGAPTFVSATSFSLPGDQTFIFPLGTRVKTLNTGGLVYGTVVRSVFTTLTTVTIIPDSGSLDSGLSQVSTGVLTVANPSLPGSLTTPPFRNRIFNGQFRISTRSGSASQIIASGGTIAYTVDRFYASCTGANVTVQRVAGTGYQHAFQITGAVSNGGTLFGQRIESLNCTDWANKQINVQVPISATGISTLTWNAYVADTTDNWSSKTLLGTGSISLTGTPETKFFSFSAGANAGRGIAIEFVSGPLVAAQSIVFQGAIQAEATEVSTYEYIDFGQEIIRCKRYLQYWQSSSTNDHVALGQCVTTTVAFVSFPFDVEMRTAPSAVIATGGFSISAAGGTPQAVIAPGIGMNTTSKKAMLISCSVASGLIAGNAAYLQGTLATSQLLFAAEL